jgi:Fe-S-cluster containining protein
VSDAPPDCQACGACCLADHDRHVPVTGADHARLAPAEQVALTTWTENRCFLRVEGGRCAALAVEGGRFACTIYERRPQVCRDLARGGPACAHEHATKGAAARRLVLVPVAAPFVPPTPGPSDPGRPLSA